ncbi:MAG: hypothetical protein Q8M83_03775 [bacterium]|nr:hypothetical protein [bacterium]
MRRFFSLILVMLAATLLTVLLVFEGARKDFLNPDFYLTRFQKFDFYSAALEQSKGMLLSQIPLGVGFPLSQKQAGDLIGKIFTTQYLQEETTVFFQDFFFWFKSDDLASNLQLMISLKTPKANVLKEAKSIFGNKSSLSNVLMAQVPDQIDLTALDDKSVQEVKEATWQARYYYNILLTLEKLLWGGLALFLIFIILLLIDSFRVIARYLGGVALLAGIEMSFLVFVLPAAVAKFLLFSSAPEGLSQEFYNVLTAMGLDMIKDAFDKLKIIGWIFLGIGAFLILASYLIGVFKDKRKRLEENIVKS